MGLKIEFTDKEITPWGGMILMKQLIEKTKISEVLERLPLPVQGSNRGYKPTQLIKNFWVSIWSGAIRFEHLEITRMDKVIQKIFGWKQMAGHKSFQRYFKKFGQGDNQRIFTELFNWFFRQIKFDNYTLDLDSTIMTRYGRQQGAKKGYNPKKPGRNSHHPLIAFVADVRMVVNFWLRSGNSYTTNNFYNFLENTLERLESKTIGLLRADSGFYDKKIFDYLENRVKPISYIIAAKLYRPLKLSIARQKTYLKLDDGIEISDTMYQSPEWEKPRRMIIVRQEISLRPKSTGKQLRLFGEEEVYKNYRYSCFITNLSLSAKMIWDAYRNRAEAENRIKELKEDFGADSFNVENFFATEAALNFVMMGYNLMSLFRQAILGTKTQQQLKTLRYKVFAIGSYITKNGNQRILKLSLAMKQRSWFEGIWSSTN
ncbi:MAG: IS1380 family transposase, partial [Ignavibacteriaceae bacterium]